ncbi:unnamed protein product [Lupinus luteus]|uniref:Pistil-specific extensin-like protein n=1 Tax=Lupinus luteus TaxID=3873 RepID=A0AAV1WRL1_LUPLU
MALVLLFFIVTSFTVSAEELIYPLPPTSPHHAHSPLHPPHHHHPPASAPFAPPHTPAAHHLPRTRTFVAVQGVVYIKPCKYAGVDTLLGATPLLGAIVKFQCNNTKYKLVQTAKTDKNGYFFLEAPKTITTYGVHKCNVVLVSAPNGLRPSNLHGGVTGSILRPEKPYISQMVPFLLYTVGPLAFNPKCPH